MSGYTHKVRMAGAGRYAYEIYPPGKMLPEPPCGSYKTYAQANAAGDAEARRRNYDTELSGN
jgi:hypothetical protein